MTAEPQGTLPDTPPRPTRAMSLDEALFARGYEFDFFQAVRLLEMLADDPDRPAGPPPDARPVPAVTVSFLGMTGPCGALPLHYTHLLMRLAREGRGSERTALRDWLDLFNHRAVSLFFRAWEKYRFPVPYFRHARG